MKNAIAIVLAFAALASAQTYNKMIRGNDGQSIPIFGSSSTAEPTKSSVMYLDTTEVDTSKYFYDLVDKPILSLTDTIGFIHFAVKDSSGTDSAAARVVWWGNSHSDGSGVWQLIDSVTKGPTASASSYANATPTPVINSKGYMAIRFTIKNPLFAAAAQKCAVKGVVLNRNQRQYYSR